MLNSTFSVHLIHSLRKCSQIIFFKNEFIPKNMIEMAMSIQKEDRFKVLFLNKSVSSSNSFLS